MSPLKALISVSALSAGLLLSAVTQAHPKLLSSNPSDGATVTSPAKIELSFSEKLTTQFSGAKLIMTEMPGMSSHSPMGIKATVAGSADPKMMVITPAAPLPPGTYKVEWRAVSSDTHPITGAVTFTVN
ncbi:MULTISPECIES: copper homeostasis periplasmic binding protein CopC [unclassified Pseudomonas]|jgi:methionine-rich copper-binding protein CopC|uniref:copper homeostasis periplasmic binding protein CopC n=1 Tax=unclassified Pseudomonas TaxID=196821 RepID=UPI0038BD3089